MQQLPSRLLASEKKPLRCTDWQVSESNFTATPRRDLLAIWMWLNDVPESRAAMRVLPASHRPIMRHWENVLQVRA